MARPRKFNENDVLDAVTDLFTQHGYTATSLSMIMDATGLLKGSIYAAFNSKEELFKKCLTRYMDRKFEATRTYLDDAPTAFEGIENYMLDELLSSADDHEHIARGCLIVSSMMENAPDDPDIKITLLQQAERMAHAFDESIRQAQGEGHIRLDMDAEDISAQIVTFMNGMRVYVRSNMSAGDIKRQCRVFLRSIAPSKTLSP